MDLHPIIKESFTKVEEGIGIGAATIVLITGAVVYNDYNSTVNKIIRSSKSINSSISNSELKKSFNALSFDQQRQIQEYINVYGADDFLEKFGTREGYFNPTINFERSFQNFSTFRQQKLNLLTNKTFTNELNEDLEARLIGLSDDNLSFLNKFKVGKEKKVASVLNSISSQEWETLAASNPDFFQNALESLFYSYLENNYKAFLLSNGNKNELFVPESLLFY